MPGAGGISCADCSSIQPSRERVDARGVRNLAAVGCGRPRAGAVGPVVEGPPDRGRIERRAAGPEIEDLLALTHAGCHRGVTLEARQVVVDVVVVVAGEVAPEQGALDLLVAVVGDAHPGMPGAEDLRHAVGVHPREHVVGRRVLQIVEVGACSTAAPVAPSG